MLVNTLRLYERILLGFDSDEEQVQAAATTMLSFLVIHLKLKHIVLPPELLPVMEYLPLPEMVP